MSEKRTNQLSESGVDKSKRNFLFALGGSATGLSIAKGISMLGDKLAENKNNELKHQYRLYFERDLSELQKEVVELKNFILKLKDLRERVRAYIAGPKNFTPQESADLIKEVKTIGNSYIKLTYKVQLRIEHLKIHGEKMPSEASPELKSGINIENLLSQAEKEVEDLNSIIPDWEDTVKDFNSFLSGFSEIKAEQQIL